MIHFKMKTENKLTQKIKIKFNLGYDLLPISPYVVMPVCHKIFYFNKMLTCITQ